MKRFFTLLCTALMLIQASAYDFSVMTEGEFPMRLYYAVNPDGKTVTIVEGPDTYVGAEVIIPSTVTNDGKNYTVTTIGASAFENADIDSVYMANTITDIQNRAFIGSSVRKIAFSKGLKRIGDYAFDHAQDLGIVELPEGLESIGKSAFGGNMDVSGNTHGAWLINLPSTLQFIGDYAFSGTSITSIKWPASINAIPNGAFESCRRLLEVELPETLVSIGNWAFGYTSLDTIAFPSSLRNIGEYTFYETPLKCVTLPDNVETLGMDAFRGCSSLSELNFSKSMTTIPHEVCKYCTQLTNVNIPSTIKSIGIEAFYGCERLNTIYIPEGVEELGNGIFNNAGIINISLPSTIHKIPETAFFNCPVVELIIPESVDSIMSNAISSCTELKKITLPKRLKFIDSYAFSGNKKLQTLELGNYMEEIGIGVFYRMEDLTEIHVHRTLPPKIRNYYGWANMIIDENCTAALYIPRGTTRSYESADGWKDFLKIIEEDVDGTVNYNVQVRNKSGNGQVNVNGQENEFGIYEVEYNHSATLILKPNSGWMLQSLIINENDVTNEVINNQYIIENMTENQIVEVVFKMVPITLSIKSGNGGQVDANIEYGEKFTFNVVPEEGWKVNSVIFNGQDVTSELENGAYTTPELYRDATLNVSFESTEDAISETQVSRAKVYALDGRIVVSGTSAGDSISIYDEGGMCVENGIATGSEWIGNAKPGRVYVVKLPHKTVKIAM